MFTRRRLRACAIIEEADGTIRIEQRQFGAIQTGSTRLWPNGRRRYSLIKWVMESTGIYWKSPYAATGDRWHSRHWSSMPGMSRMFLDEKTDVGDAQWLATLARGPGLLRGSFIPPALMRELRLISRPAAEAGRPCCPPRKIACTR